MNKTTNYSAGRAKGVPGGILVEWQFGGQLPPPEDILSGSFLPGIKEHDEEDQSEDDDEEGVGEIVDMPAREVEF